MNTEIKTKEEWEERWKKEFPISDSQNPDIKSFISDLLTSQKEQFATQIIEALEGKKKEIIKDDEGFEIPTDIYISLEKARGINQALSKAQQIIKELK